MKLESEDVLLAWSTSITPEDSQMQCVIKFMEDGQIHEETIEIKANERITTLKLLELGKQFLEPKNAGRKKWDPKATLLSIKPVIMKEPGAHSFGGWKTG